MNAPTTFNGCLYFITLNIPGHPIMFWARKRRVWTFRKPLENGYGNQGSANRAAGQIIRNAIPEQKNQIAVDFFTVD